MQISILLAQQIAQLFLILIMGYAVVKAGLLKASDSKVLSVVMVYLVTPCVIINAFQINDTPEIRKGLLYSMAIAAAIHVVLLVLSALLSRPLKLDAVEQVNVIYSNAAALVIPLVKALMGDAYVIYHCAAGAAVDPRQFPFAGQQCAGLEKGAHQYQHDRHCSRCTAVLVPCGAACTAAEYHEHSGQHDGTDGHAAGRYGH